MTRRLVIGMAAGPSVLALGLLAVLQVGCPHNPPPTPVGPDASDAAPAPDPTVPCADLCTHAETVCPGAGAPCATSCLREGADWKACVARVPAGASACPQLNACDPLNGVAGARPGRTGR